MMIIKELQKKVFEYQKSGDVERVSVLRYLLAQIKNKEIDLRTEDRDLDKADVVTIINKQIKQRRVSADLYRKGNRETLALKEESEKELLAEILQYVENF